MLPGLNWQDAVQLLQSQGFQGSELGLTALVQLYRGNPLALKMATPLIQSLFGSNVAAFLNQKTPVLGDRLRAVLVQQFHHLSALEQDILYWLAIWQEPISLNRLHTHLFLPPSITAVLEAIAALDRQSLLERWFQGDDPAFTLQPLVMQMVTDHLVEQTVQEIKQGIQHNTLQSFRVLRTHWLLRPGTDDLEGDRILNQLRDKLWHIYGGTLPQVLHQLTALTTEQSPQAVGYSRNNLRALLGYTNRG